MRFFSLKFYDKKWQIKDKLNHIYTYYWRNTFYLNFSIQASNQYFGGVLAVISSFYSLLEMQMCSSLLKLDKEHLWRSFFKLFWWFS